MKNVYDSIPDHDAYFRENFSNPAAAASLVRLAAPPEVVRLLELDKLTPLPTAQFDPDMGKRIPDLLFECPFRAGRIVVTILFEHKSAPDYQIALQFLRYMLLDHEQRRKQNPHQHVLVLPILVYHGTRRWNPSFALVNERHVPQALRPYILRVPAFVVDLHKVTDETLETHPDMDEHSRATLLVLKHIFQDNPQQADFLRRLAQRILAMQATHRPRFLERTILYLVYTGRVQRPALEPLVEDLNEDIAMRYKTGHQLDLEDAFQKGESQGIEQGIETGLQRGLDLEKIANIEGMLANGLDWALIQSITHLNETGFKELRERYGK